MPSLRTIALASVIVGVFFRFANIGEKLFWMDEVYTALRVSGYTMAEMKAQLLDGHPITKAELQTFEFRNTERGPTDVIDGLAMEDSHHPPLYFLSLRAWQSWFGSSVPAARYFSAVSSLLLFPSLLWLDRGLSPEQDRFGLIAVALAAVSPVHIVFAQQARPYAMWTVLIVASSAALVCALRRQKLWTWCLYAVLLAISFYTHLLSLGICLAHFLMVMYYPGRQRRQIHAFLFALAVALLSFAPWLVAVANSPPTQGFGRAQQPFALWPLASQWCGVISRVFVDFGANPASSWQLKLGLIPILLPVMLLIVVGLNDTLRHAPATLRALCGGVVVPFCLVYLGSHFFFGRHVATTRHLLPVLIMIELAVAFSLSRGQASSDERSRKRSQLVTAVVLGLGVASCCMRLPTSLWWDQIPLDNSLTPEIIERIGSTKRPLIVSDAEPIENAKMMFFHTIAAKLDNEVLFQLVPSEQLPLPPQGYSDIFLVSPSPALLRKAGQAYGPNGVQVNDRLWTWESRSASWSRD